MVKEESSDDQVDTINTESCQSSTRTQASSTQLASVKTSTVRATAEKQLELSVNKDEQVAPKRDKHKQMLENVSKDKQSPIDLYQDKQSEISPHRDKQLPTDTKQLSSVKSSNEKLLPSKKLTKQSSKSEEKVTPASLPSKEVEGECKEVEVCVEFIPEDRVDESTMDTLATLASNLKPLGLDKDGEATVEQKTEMGKEDSSITTNIEENVSVKMIQMDERGNTIEHHIDTIDDNSNTLNTVTSAVDGALNTEGNTVIRIQVKKSEVDGDNDEYDSDTEIKVIKLETEENGDGTVKDKKSQWKKSYRKHYSTYDTGEKARQAQEEGKIH